MPTGSLRFHSVHGTNVQLSPDRKTAKRLQKFADAVIYSDRPLQAGEKVRVKVTQVTEGTDYSPLRFGFTKIDPSSMTRVPEISVHLQHGHWWNLRETKKHSKDIKYNLNAELLYFLSPDGKNVEVSVSQPCLQESQPFKWMQEEPPSSDQPLWLALNVCGPTCEVTLQDEEEYDNKNGTPDEKYSKWKFLADKHGQHIRILNNGRTVRRVAGLKDHGAAYLSNTMKPGDTLTLKCTQNVCCIPGSGTFLFGFSAEHPSSVKNLPQKACPDLLAMPNIVGKNVDVPYDECLDLGHNPLMIYFIMKEDYCVYVKTGSSVEKLFLVGFDGPMWPFVFLMGIPSELEIGGGEAEVTDKRLLTVLKKLQRTDATNTIFKQPDPLTTRVPLDLTNQMEIIQKTIAQAKEVYAKRTSTLAKAQDILNKMKGLNLGDTTSKDQGQPQEKKSCHTVSCCEHEEHKPLKSNDESNDESRKSEMDKEICEEGGSKTKEFNQENPYRHLKEDSNTCSYESITNLKFSPDLLYSSSTLKPQCVPDGGPFRPISEKDSTDALIWCELAHLKTDKLQQIADCLTKTLTKKDLNLDETLSVTTYDVLADGSSVTHNAVEYVITLLKSNVEKLEQHMEMEETGRKVTEIYNRNNNKSHLETEKLNIQTAVILRNLIQKTADAVMQGTVKSNIEPNEDPKDAFPSMRWTELEEIGITTAELKDVLETMKTGIKPDRPRYEELLYKAKEFIKLNDLNNAELNLAQAVRESQNHPDYIHKESECFEIMANVYLERAIRMTNNVASFTDDQEHHLVGFVKAMGLVQASITRTGEKEHLRHQADHIERMFLMAVGVDPTDELISKGKVTMQYFTQRMTMLREETKNVLKLIENDFGIGMNTSDKITETIIQEETRRSEAVQRLYAQVHDSMKNMIAELTEGCATLLGKPPCSFTLIALGSMARKEMTPFSDLEFAILIPEDNPEFKSYFRHLSYLMHLKILTFRESIIPALCVESLNDYKNPHGDWYYDVTGRQGFCFDGLMPNACKLPYGRPNDDIHGPGFELIGTPEELAELCKDKRFSPELHLKDVLINVCHITGEKSLIAEYISHISLLTESYNSRQLDGTQESDLDNFLLNISEWNTNVLETGDEGKLMHVKKELYRLPCMVVQNLGLLYGFSCMDSWDVLTAFLQSKLFSESEVHHLRTALTIAMEWRMRAYFHYGSQKEMLSSLPCISDPIPQEKSQDPVNVPLGSLLRLYYTLIPIQQSITKMFGRKKSDAIPKEISLYDASIVNQVMVRNKLQDYNGILKLLSSYPEEEMSSDMVIVKALSLFSSGYIHKAINMLKKAVEKENHLDEPKDQVKKRNCLSLFLQTSGKEKEALEVTLESIAILEQNEHMSTHELKAAIHGTLSSIYASLGNFDKALFYIRKAMMEQEVETSTKSSVGMFVHLIQASGLLYDLGKYEEAYACAKHAINMTKFLFGINTVHPFTAAALSCMGRISSEMGKYEDANSYYNSSLRISEAFHQRESFHINILLHRYQLAVFNYNRGKYKLAKINLEKISSAFEENERRLENMSPTFLSDFLCSLALILLQVGELSKAREMISKAKEISSRHDLMVQSGSCHKVDAEILFNTGDFENALLSINKALSVDSQLEHIGLPRNLNAVITKMDILADMGKFEEVIITGQAALNHLETMEGQRTPWSLHMTMGNAYRMQDNLLQAGKHYQKAFETAWKIYQNIAYHPNVAALLSSLGTYLEKKKVFSQAVFMQQRALAILDMVYGKDAALRNKVQFLLHLGNCLHQAGRLKESVQVLKKAVQVADKLSKHGNSFILAGCYNNIALVLQDIGDVFLSYHCLTSALEAARDSFPDGKHLLVAAVLNNLARIYQDYGELHRAILYFEESLEIHNNLFPNVKTIKKAETMLNLGNALLGADANRGMKLILQGSNMRLEVIKSSMEAPDMEFISGKS